MKVLVVDDEYLELEQLTYLVKRKYPYWEVYAAEDAAQAKKLAAVHPFKLAFIDIHLPGQSGLDLVHTLKQLHPMMTFIIITAYQDFEYAKRAIQLEVLDYLVKPLIESELDSALQKFIQKHPEALVKSSIIQEAIEYIHANYGQKISLYDIAEAIHVNPAYLSKRFTEETGMHFKDYVIHYRIEKAKELLIKRQDWSVARIAEETGFASQHHFSNSFRKYVGMTPTQYKEKYV
ncbi:response regulator transcription factor [Saccharococcus caldoxylosilyticus]|jgi:two-component system, response regulator YesN|uniref:Putative two-component response regulator n=1 Tax=Parageobacillus caldoxylosilyticus NBRC 107762 TaxID=1220594 RepID=A0A023DIA3_9BACL|nr:helix-turn-helix domain-containing protein [Parageobacillus caldoxylosilyticus]OQP04489.1 DNA-binding response regulator [Geobacillus sp. 44B]MBB3853783.1 YesN/AraC family two-component response regulator [Parageobacillus caldoxylosilyticus]QNU36589.1 helix-turn-helix domain-containing protein [Geobacillus sp. 44B]QXJ39771.1 putative response regulatory protein [Parageobacillus caldoxylosilyticus]BDG36625.1 DNA-binding response regulator [Parageobacillus caldoxylosilyticus]